MRQLQAVHIGHLDVCQYNIRRLLLSQIQRLDPVMGIPHDPKAYALPIYFLLHRADDVFFVVHHKH